MKLSDCLDHRWMDLGLHPEDRDDLLRRVVETLHATGALREVDSPLRSLIEREEAMTTGIGDGVAIPHARTAAAPRTVLAVSHAPAGVDFKAVDGKPVDLIFTLLGPEENARIHVSLLARIARLLRKGRLHESLLGAASPEDMVRILREREETVLG
jgi:mannitol/fructose-specific phosphotransferase system IIA component (Ntr-type)